MPNILIADDSPYIRTAYRRIIETQGDLEVSRVVENGLEAVKAVTDLDIDVAILDVRMPKLDGISASKKIRELSPSTAIVIVSAYDDWTYVQDLINSDPVSKAYLLKNSLDDIGELIRVVRRVSEDYFILDSVLIDKLVGYYQRHSQPSDRSLQDIDLKILSLNCSGMDIQEISFDIDVPVDKVSSSIAISAALLDLTNSQHLQPDMAVAFLDLCINLFNQSS
jgi:DNA-binding NarL/FixJ family response regulator